MFLDTYDLNNHKLMDDLETDLQQNKENIASIEEARGVSFIIMAISQQRLNFAEWLVDNGALVNISVDGTPLSKACYQGNPRLIKKILDKCTDEFRTKHNPMSQAIYSTNTTHVDVLLKNGFDINEKDSYDCSPLYYAISALEVLDITHSDKEFKSTKQELKMVDHLLSKGAVLDNQAKQALSYLFELECEITHKDILSVVSYLIKTDYEKSKSKNKKPILQNILKLLLEHNGATEVLKVSQTEHFLCDLVSLSTPEPFEFSLPYVNVKELSEHVQFELFKNACTDAYKITLLECGLNPNSKSEYIENEFTGKKRIRNILCETIYFKEFNSASLLLKYGADFKECGSSPGKDALTLLISNAAPEDKELGALQVLQLIMEQRPDLLSYDFTKSISNSSINNIFDIALSRRVHDWFREYEDTLHPYCMTTDEITKYEENKFDFLVNRNNRPETINWVQNN